MTESSWFIKYRPNEYQDVIGQDNVVRSLVSAISKRSSHSFLLIGPAGTGKTTLARLGADQLGCKPSDLQEIDAASNTGIDDMRAVARDLMYQPIGEGAVKVVVVDECHMLSKQAWNSLLKIVEEPPDHVYWFFCTTEANKVPASIKSRCASYELKPVSTPDLVELLCFVREQEKLKVDEGIIALCVKEARGSPRQALANLAVCATAKTKAEAAELLQSAEESKPAFALAQALFRGAPWSELQGILSQIGEVNPESVRHMVMGYGNKVVLGAKSEKTAGPAIEVLDAFSTPFNSGDGITPLIIACGKIALS